MNINHYKTIKYLEFYNIQDPHFWIFTGCFKKLIFNNCKFSKNLIEPLNNINTEEIEIYTNSNNTIFTFDISKFPFLKKVYTNCKYTNIGNSSVEIIKKP